MNILTSIAEREVIASVKYLPAVSIIIPFTPVITLKKNLESRLKNVLGKVEAMLTTNYTAEKAMPIIFKLKNIFNSLNYNSDKKSIAIFVSPVVESVCYFGVEMEEKITVEPSFKISDLLYCKKEKKEYLILHLGDKFSKMYLCGTQLKLIKSNTLVNVHHYENKADAQITLLANVPDREEVITNKFLHQMDQGLSIILKSYPIPVFVIGPDKLLLQFRKLTKNDESIMQFIAGNYEEASESDLGNVMEHVTLHWQTLKPQHLLKQVENAKTQNKLRAGLEETLKAAMQNKGRLLIVERRLARNSQASKTYEPFTQIDSTSSEVFFIKDKIDDIIKRVFETGGDVELVEDGLLKNYKHIALVED